MIRPVKRLWCLFVMLPLLIYTSVVAQAQNGGLSVLCNSLPEYRPAPGVEYEPGIDAKGRAVLPADLNAPLNGGVDKINIPITLDLAQRFNIFPANGIELKPDVGLISVYKDGRVEYNGQDLARQAYTLCAHDTKILLPPDGQPPADNVSSATDNR
ncbi:MAG: hypothetical protein IT559_01110 [Alphaproteobacteria bacterium]|nr:hypothetical protein [Alphaproteobacteria bacterium]